MIYIIRPLGLIMYIISTLEFPTHNLKISSIDNECKCQILFLIYYIAGFRNKLYRMCIHKIIAAIKLITVNARFSAAVLIKLSYFLMRCLIEHIRYIIM